MPMPHEIPWVALARIGLICQVILSMSVWLRAPGDGARGIYQSAGLGLGGLGCLLFVWYVITSSDGDPSPAAGAGKDPSWRKVLWFTAWIVVATGMGVFLVDWEEYSSGRWKQHVAGVGFFAIGMYVSARLVAWVMRFGASRG